MIAFQLIATFLLVAADGKADLYKWFDTLGHDAVLSKPFVRVDTWYMSGEEKRRGPTEFGFLIKTEGKSFTILTTDLRHESYPVWGRDRRVDIEGSYKILDMRAELLRQIPILKKQPEERYWDYENMPAAVRGMTGQFVIARAADARGLLDLGAKFYELSQAEAETSGTPFSRGSWTRQREYASAVKEQIAQIRYGQILQMFEDFDMPRAKIRAEVARFAKDFLDSELHKHAVSLIKRLDPMIVEDAAHIPSSDKVQELIYQLRDQSGANWYHPGRCDVFADPQGEKSPAAQLAKIGLPAVPKLMQVLEDKTLSRAIEWEYVVSSGENVLTVGYAVEQIIRRIAGKGFYYSAGSEKMTTEQREAHVHGQMRQWWADVQRLGEEAVLKRDILGLPPEYTSQGQRLVEAYPARALPALLAAIKKNPGPGGARYVSLLEKVPGPAAIKAARNHMYYGAGLDIRFAAAQVVAKTDPDAATEAMRREWRRVPLNKQPIDYLAAFLIESGRPEAMKTLAEGLGKRAPEARIEVVRELKGPEAFREGYSFTKEKRPTFARVKNAYRAAAEALIVERLTDKGQARTGMASMGVVDYGDERICDMAGVALAQHWPKKYIFKPSQSTYQRDVQLVKWANVWRSEHGLSALPLPRRAVIKRVALSEIAGHLARIVADPSDKSGPRELLNVGLPALPWVEEEMERQSGPAKETLRRLASSLASTVREVRVSGVQGTAFPGLQGTQLTTRSLMKALRRLVTHWPRGKGVKVVLDRDVYGAGFTCTVEESSRDMHGNDWDYSDTVVADGKVLYGSSGGGTGSSLYKESEDKDFARAVHRALASRSGAAVRIDVEVVRGKQ